MSHNQTRNESSVLRAVTARPCQRGIKHTNPLRDPRKTHKAPEGEDQHCQDTRQIREDIVKHTAYATTRLKK